MFRIFVSFAAGDRDAALPIIEAIGRAGLAVSHPDMIPLGEDFRRSIQREIETADCVVILWSETAAQSHFVQQEVRRAIQAWSSDRLVLAALDDAPLPIGLRDLSAISIRDASDFGTKQLIERARAIVGRRAGTTMPAAPEPADYSYEPRRPERTAQADYSPAPRSAGWIFASALIAGFTILIGGMLVLRRTVPPIPTPSPAPLPPVAPLTVSSFLVILIVLLLGAAVGAGAVWIWSAQSRRRSNLAFSMAPSRQVSPGSNGPSQIFVSYSHQDAQTVEQLVKQIEQLGYGVWIDREAKGSQRYAAPIVRAIRTSRLVALMCSQNAFTSDHVVREVYVAGDYKKPFITFELDSTQFPDEILYFISGFPRIPVASMDPQRLRSEIARLVAA